MKENWSIDKLQDIWQKVSKLHDGQKYGGYEKGEQVEYINHIGSVVFEILKAINFSENFNADLAIHCAILHDSIEDTEFTYKEILDSFGEDIANGVLALTKNETLQSKQEGMLDSLGRIKQQPKEIWAVKIADRICNLYAPPFYWTNEKKKYYIEESIIIYNTLKEGNSYLADRLKHKIRSYNSFLDE